MRNQFPGTCYYCGVTVAAKAGHFERHRGSWRTIHARCVHEQRAAKEAAKCQTP
jgi:hypothetical protein